MENNETNIKGFLTGLLIGCFSIGIAMLIDYGLIGGGLSLWFPFRVSGIALIIGAIILTVFKLWTESTE